MALKIEVKDFWVVTLQVEDGGSKDLQNIGDLLQHYTVTQPRRPWMESGSTLCRCRTFYFLWRKLCMHIKVYFYKYKSFVDS